MAIYDKELGLIPSDEDLSAQQALEAPDKFSTDVRSTVQSQFRQMDQEHDRIRAEELTARLAGHTIQ